MEIDNQSERLSTLLGYGEVRVPDKYCHLLHMHKYFKKRSSLLGWLTVSDRPYLNVPKEMLGLDVLWLRGASSGEEAWMVPTLPGVTPDRPLTYYLGSEGKHADYETVFAEEGLYTYGVTVLGENPQVIRLVKLGPADQPPFSFSEEFDLPPGILKISGNSPIHTDVGKFLMNYLLLEDPFGEYFSYINDLFDLGDIEKRIAAGILDGKITRDQFNVYMNNGYWFGEDASVTTPTLTPRSITTDPNIKKRKQELIEANKDHLDDPTVVSKIENELIAMDKAWLKDDPSEGFYATDGKKAFNEQRKKMHVSVGLMAGFDKVEGKYEFVPENLRNGWEMQHLDIAANDVRRGSYGRGKETALGGMQSKFILRIFQGLKITEEDCGTKRGLTITLTTDNIKQYYGRWLAKPSVVLLTKENADLFIGKEVVIRSPMYCATEGGFCYHCCGKLFEKLGMDMAGMNALIITSGFTSTAMKAQHMSSVAAVKISDVQHYLR